MDAWQGMNVRELLALTPGFMFCHCVRADTMDRYQPQGWRAHHFLQRVGSGVWDEGCRVPWFLIETSPEFVICLTFLISLPHTVASR